MADKRHWEVGSEFHWQGIPKGPFIQWPKPHIMYSTGREALLGISQVLQNEFSKILFVPEFFCNEVIKWWMKQGITVRHYIDGPHLKEPVWETLNLSKHDAVLAVNCFGIRDGNVWKQWQKDNKSVFLIEDHSHDPVSDWALSSKADYAFASLRKTFPVPDGAIMWSPKGLPLPNEPVCNDWRGSSLKLAAMILKKEYLEGEKDRLKEIFRSFQLQGEIVLGESQNISISPWSRFLLAYGYPKKWREIREENVRIFLKLINRSSVAKALFTEWPKDHCPFNPVLLFPSRVFREKYRSRLIESQIYPAVHWDLGEANSSDILSLSERIMTIPVDQRYNRKDIYHIADIILS